MCVGERNYIAEQGQTGLWLFHDRETMMSEASVSGADKKDIP